MGIISQVIEGARVNARRNGITNAVFYTGKAEEVLPAFYEGKLASEFCQDAGRITKEDTVIDAYCGVGKISLIAADYAGKVVGVESNAQAVKDARENAKRNNCTNAEFYCQDAGVYQVKVIQPVDLFPGTKHVETVVLLSRKVDVCFNSCRVVI